MARYSEHEYHFFSHNQDPQGSGIEPIPAGLWNQVKFTPCRTVQFGKYFAFQWRAVYKVLFGNFDTYILEGSFTILTNWLAIPAARLRGKRVLLYSHGWLHRESGCKGWLRIRFYRLANGLLLYGNRAKEIGEAYGFSPEKLYVAFNSLDDVSINHWRERITWTLCDDFRSELLGADSTKPLIIGVGRLNKAKNYPLLLRAADCLGRQGCDVNILLVGDGPERIALEHMAKEIGIRMTITGARYDEEFISLCFSSSDMTVIPGAAGLTVIHSLSYGTPVVVHDNYEKQGPEADAVKDGINGALFRFGDAGALADAIKRVFDILPRSPDVAEQCRSTVETTYSPKRMRTVFDHAVDGRSASLSLPNEGIR